jgi:hypothetical protein
MLFGSVAVDYEDENEEDMRGWNLLGKRATQWRGFQGQVSGGQLLQGLGPAGGEGGVDSFLCCGKGADGHWFEGPKHHEADSGGRLFDEIERGVVCQMLAPGPDAGHLGKFREGNLPQPARLRFETEIQTVRKHHGNVSRAVLQGALDGNGIGHSAVSEGMAIHVIKTARGQRHGGGSAQRGEDVFIAGVEIDGVAGMAIGQHNEKTRRRILQGFDGKWNVSSEDVIDEVGEINNGLAAKEIGFAHYFAGVAVPDGQGRLPHSGDKIGGRAGAGRRCINEIVLAPAPIMEKGEHARRPRAAHGAAFHDERGFATGARLSVWGCGRHFSP